MIIEKTVGNQKTENTKELIQDRVELEWYECEKKLLSKTSRLGEELGIRVSKPLKDGDILYLDEKRVISVELLPTELICTPVHTMEEMGWLCFELGNRHLSLAIQADRVMVPYDEPTFLYLKKLGFSAEKVEAKFEDYRVCKAHGHSHSHEHSEHPEHAKDHHHNHSHGDPAHGEAE